MRVLQMSVILSQIIKWADPSEKGIYGFSDVMRANNVHDVVYGKILLIRCIPNFKSDLINNMGHMRISGTEPSPVTLIQTK